MPIPFSALFRSWSEGVVSERREVEARFSALLNDPRPNLTADVMAQWLTDLEIDVSTTPVVDLLTQLQLPHAHGMPQMYVAALESFARAFERYWKDFRNRAHEFFTHAAKRSDLRPEQFAEEFKANLTLTNMFTSPAFKRWVANTTSALTYKDLSSIPALMKRKQRNEPGVYMTTLPESARMTPHEKQVMAMPSAVDMQTVMTQMIQTMVSNEAMSQVDASRVRDEKCVRVQCVDVVKHALVRVEQSRTASVEQFAPSISDHGAWPVADVRYIKAKMLSFVDDIETQVQTKSMDNVLDTCGYYKVAMRKSHDEAARKQQRSTQLSDALMKSYVKYYAHTGLESFKRALLDYHRELLVSADRIEKACTDLMLHNRTVESTLDKLRKEAHEHIERASARPVPEPTSPRSAPSTPLRRIDEDDSEDSDSHTDEKSTEVEVRNNDDDDDDGVLDKSRVYAAEYKRVYRAALREARDSDAVTMYYGFAHKIEALINKEKPSVLSVILSAAAAHQWRERVLDACQSQRLMIQAIDKDNNGPVYMPAYHRLRETLSNYDRVAVTTLQPYMESAEKQRSKHRLFLRSIKQQLDLHCSTLLTGMHLPQPFPRVTVFDAHSVQYRLPDEWVTGLPASVAVLPNTPMLFDEMQRSVYAAHVLALRSAVV